MEKLSCFFAKSKKLAGHNLTNLNKLKLHKEIDRRKSFVENDWSNEIVDFKELALQGFYFIEKPNIVKCKFCHIELSKFNPKDDLLIIHFKLSPNCPLLRRRETRNVSVDPEELDKILPPASYDECDTIRKQSRIEDEVAYPEYRLPSTRLKTFELWPSSNKQNPKDLCDAGFFYDKEFEGASDATICFACGLEVVKWMPSDNPWIEHKRLLKKECSHLQSNQNQLKLNEKLYKESTSSKKSADSDRKSSVTFIPYKQVTVCGP